MILTLFVVSALLLVFGLFMFLKRKALLGWFFFLLSVVGFAIASTVIYFFPDKI